VEAPPAALDNARGEKQGFIPILNLLGKSTSPGAEAGAPGKPGFWLAGVVKPWEALSHDANPIKLMTSKTTGAAMVR